MNPDATSGIIYSLIRDHLGNYLIWDRIEKHLVALCSDLPNANHPKNKDQLINALKSIKLYLLEEGVESKEIEFLNEEIDRYESTNQISLYQEQDDTLPKEIIDAYAAMKMNEGVIGVKPSYNYLQLATLTRGIHQRTGLIKFFVSNEVTISGKVVAELYEHPQEIPVVTLAQSTKKMDDDYPQKIFLMGEKFDKRNYTIIREIPVKFRVYRFISQTNNDYLLLTQDEIDIGDYVISGVTTKVDDFKTVSETAKLPTKITYLFAQKITGRITRFATTDEFRHRIAELGINKESIFDMPLAIYHRSQERFLKAKHPEWFKWMIWAWSLHHKEGVDNEYPLHLMIVGEAGGGKSTLMNRLHHLSNEARDVFSGSQSTLKSLIPSFKYNPVRYGYLAESNRFSFLDEFLRCVMRTQTREGEREEMVGMMNDLLEHQKREAGSGVSSGKINMTARAIVVTNPQRGIKNVTDLIGNFDKAFMSRLLVYWQTKEHVKAVRDSAENVDELEEQEFMLSSDEWVSLVDYLQGIRAKYDNKKVIEIYNHQFALFNEDLADHYASRHKHHIKCLMDGIIKARCLFERDMSFSAKEIDYERLETMWAAIISSWIDIEDIKRMPLERRKYYLPEDTAYLWDKICKYKKPIPTREAHDAVGKGFSQNEFVTNFMILRDLRLIRDESGSIKPYYMKDEEERDERQTKIVE